MTETRTTDHLTPDLKTHESPAGNPVLPARCHRYALYYAPAVGSPWWQFGAHWLGRDECHDLPLTQPDLEGITGQELAFVTAVPRRYGFHATLRAPFILTEQADESALVGVVEKLAASLRPVRLGALVPARISGFVALMPPLDPPGLATLGRQCVLALESLRAPMDEAERARKYKSHLDARERELLDQYGYPHVMDRFRFHLTLSAMVDEYTAAHLTQLVRLAVTPLNQRHAPVLDRVCLFGEREPGAPFVRLRDFPLHG